MHNTQAFLLTIGIGLAPLCARENADLSPDKAVDLDKAALILQKSRQPEELESTAIALCRSADSKALDVVAAKLLDPDFLARIDPKGDYESFETQRRTTAVVKALGRAGTAKADELLLQLIDNKPFVSNHYRLDGIIDAAGFIKHPSKRLLEFVSSKAYPGSAFTGTAISTFARIGLFSTHSEIEKRLTSLDYDIVYKLSWLSNDLLPLRNEPPIVKLYGRLLTIDLKDPRLRNRVVQTLFDYRPREWYGQVDEGNDPKPPPRKEASTDVLQDLLKISEHALKLDITKDTRQSVEMAKKEIAGILTLREQKK